MPATVEVDVALGNMADGVVVTVDSLLPVVLAEASLVAREVVGPVEEPPNRQHAILCDVTELRLQGQG